MAMLVCKKFGVGPNCSDPRLETTEAEQKDCVKIGKLQYQSRIYDCIANKFRNFNIPAPEEGAEPCIPGCLDELECYLNTDGISLLERCYCTNLSNTICTVCPDEEEEEDERPTEPAPEPGTTTISRQTLKNLGVTASAWGELIPITFGTVIVPGNMIWIGNPRKEMRTTVTHVGTNTEISQIEYGFVDFAIGLCAGDIEAVSRIWINDTLVVNNGITLGDQEATSFNKQFYDLGLNVQLLKGTAAQKALLDFEDTAGYGRAPAYRDLAVLVFRSYPVFVNTGSLPTVRAEVITRIDTDVVNFEESGENDFTPTYLKADDMSRRLYALRGGNIAAVSSRTLDIVHTIAPVSAFSQGFDISREGHISAPDGTNATLIHGGDKFDRQSTALTPIEFMNSVRIQDVEFNVFNVMAALRGTDFIWLSASQQTGAASVLETYPAVHTGTWEFLHVDEMSDAELGDAQFYAYGLAQESGYLTLVSAPIFWDAARIVFDTAELPISFPLYPPQFEFQRPITLKAAVMDPDNAMLLIWVTDGESTNLMGLRLTPALAVRFVIRDAVAPAHPGCTMRRGVSREYAYIGEDGNVWSLQKESFKSTLVQLFDTGHPTPAGPQWYDGALGTINYVSTDNRMVRYFTKRFIGRAATAREIVERAAQQANIDPWLVDASALSAVTMQGFLIMQQSNFGEVLEELTGFFHLAARDSSGRITVGSRQNASNLTVDENLRSVVETTRDVLAQEEIKGVQVSYFDIDRDGTLWTQQIGRDVMTDEQSFLANYEFAQFEAAVFTDSDTARRSAEIYMASQTQRQDTLRVQLAPKHLALEPGDRIYSGYRVRETEVDATGSVTLLAISDSLDLYTSTVLPGVDASFNQVTRRDYDAPVLGYPIIFPLPMTEDNPGQNYCYAGLLAPDDGSYVPTPLYSRGPNSAFTLAGEPTQEVMIGRLTALPDPLQPIDEFTWHANSSLQIRFNKPVVVGTLVNREFVDLLTSYRTNLLFVGRELIQYTTFEVAIDNQTVTFRGLLRGRCGTDRELTNHVLSERCAVYSPTSMVIAPLNDRALNFGIVSVATYDTRNRAVYKSDEINVSDWFVVQWNPPYTYISQDVDDVFFRNYGREPFVTTLKHSDNTYDGQLITPANADTIWVVALKGSYDEATFRQRWTEAGYPINNTGASPATNPYIHRAWKGVEVGQANYTAFALAEDGLTVDTAIRFVSFTAANDGTYTITSPIREEFKFPNTQAYTL